MIGYMVDKIKPCICGWSGIDVSETFRGSWQIICPACRFRIIGNSEHLYKVINHWNWLRRS